MLHKLLCSERAIVPLDITPSATMDERTAHKQQLFSQT